MELWQTVFVVMWSIVSVLGFLKGSWETFKNKKAFGKAEILNVLGVFVWGDAVIFGIFWVLISTLVLFLRDWILFLLLISIFWSVRSLGETIYWLNEQFATNHRNPPEKLWGYKFFKNDSIWFVYQIIWQCVMVISIVASIYVANLWLNKLN